jgi:CRP/FNR family transcriptional regulator, cyclic AMP receptor protein
MSSEGTATVAARLQAHEFFRGLPPGLVRAAASGAVERTYRAGEFLIREGRTAEEFLAVEHGKVALEIFAADRARLTVQTLGPGEVLGWSWLLPPHRWTLDAIATKPTGVVAVDAMALRERLAAHPDEGYAFLLRLLPVLAGRLHGLRMQLLEADVL